MKYRLLIVPCLFVCSAMLKAAPLTQAHVTKIINKVELVEPGNGVHTARLNDLVQGEVGLQTGEKSRSELQFQDDTLTRIGPETFFSFKAGTRDMTLDRGTMLLQVPKGHGGATIHTAVVTASITGTTIMIEHVPHQDVKVLVLEGSLRLSINRHFGESLLLTPGKMVIMKPDAKKIPDPVTVDLAHLIKTSSLINMPDAKNKIATLPSAQLIDQEIAEQNRDKSDATLVATNQFIDGRGNKVQIDSTSVLADVAQRNDPGVKHGNVSGADSGSGDGDGNGNGNGDGNGNGNGNHGNGNGDGNGNHGNGNGNGDGDGNGNGNGSGNGNHGNGNGHGNHGHGSLKVINRPLPTTLDRAGTVAK